MMFKNSLKLFCSNFDKVWKLLFYTLIVSGVVVGLLMPFFDVFKEVATTSWIESLESMPSTGLLYGSDIAALFNSAWSFIYSSVVMLLTEHLWVGVYLAVMVLLVYPFLLNIGKYVSCEMLYSYMSSQTKISFCSALVKTLRRSSLYAFLKSLASIILKAVVVGLIYLCTLVTAPIFNYFLPVVIIVGFAFVCAFGQTLISGWAPASVVYDSNVSKSYNIGIKAVFRRYLRALSTSFIINMIFIFLVMGFGIVSAIVLIPLYMGLVNMYEMNMFFASQGMRYYADADTVVSPKKLEQLDTIKNTKYLL